MRVRVPRSQAGCNYIVGVGDGDGVGVGVGDGVGLGVGVGMGDALDALTTGFGLVTGACGSSTLRRSRNSFH